MRADEDHGLSRMPQLRRVGLRALGQSDTLIDHELLVTGPRQDAIHPAAHAASCDRFKSLHGRQHETSAEARLNHGLSQRMLGPLLQSADQRQEFSFGSAARKSHPSRQAGR